MSSFDDLGRALRDDAAVNAPRASAINVDAVAHAARARRRPRQWAVGTLSVVATLGIGGLALQTVTPPTFIAASESSDAGAVESADGSDLLSEPGAPEALGDRTGAALVCGAAAPEPSAGDLTLSLDRSSTTPEGAGEVVGLAVLTNSGSAPVSISTSVGVTGALAQAGSVVTEGVVTVESVPSVDLGPGDRRELSVRVSTLDCTGQPLPAGDYVVIVALDVTLVSTGESVVVVAAPEPITID